jgi:hypothetical protein
MGRKTVHCVVGLKQGRPFAVLVARGDDTGSSLEVLPIPTADTADAAAAMHHALRRLGLEPALLAASGYEEPVVMLDELAEETTFEELQRDWAMRLLAPKE